MSLPKAEGNKRKNLLSEDYLSKLNRENKQAEQELMNENYNV